MKFSIAINMLRNSASVDVRKVWKTLPRSAAHR